MNLGAP